MASYEQRYRRAPTSAVRSDEMAQDTRNRDVTPTTVLPEGTGAAPRPRSRWLEPKGRTERLAYAKRAVEAAGELRHIAERLRSEEVATLDGRDILVGEALFEDYFRVVDRMWAALTGHQDVDAHLQFVRAAHNGARFLSRRPPAPLTVAVDIARRRFQETHPDVAFRVGEGDWELVVKACARRRGRPSKDGVGRDKFEVLCSVLRKLGVSDVSPDALKRAWQREKNR